MKVGWYPPLRRTLIAKLLYRRRAVPCWEVAGYRIKAWTYPDDDRLHAAFVRVSDSKQGLCVFCAMERKRRGTPCRVLH